MRDRTLGEVLDATGGSVKTGPFGTKLSAREYSTEGAPVISVGEVGYGALQVGPRTKRVPNSVTARMPEYLLQSGDIVFGRKGAVDRSAWVREHEDGYFLGSDGIRIRFGDGVDSRFMAYQLGARFAREWLLQHAIGTTLASLNEPTLKSVPVSLPPLPEQRAIAATLGALDDKIESNRRAIDIADSLFHARWRRLYDNLIDARSVSLGDVVKTQYGLTASADPLVSDTKFLRVTDINKKNWISWDSVPGVIIDDAQFTKYGLAKGDLLVARMADPGKSAIYDDDSVPSVFASYLVRLKPRSVDEGLYLFGFLKSAEYTTYADGAKTGSVQKNMNAKVIVNVPVRWPDPGDLRAFASEVEPIREKINQLVHESSRLAALRDALLPELLSGRIRVPVDEAA